MADQVGGCMRVSAAIVAFA